MEKVSNSGSMAWKNAEFDFHGVEAPTWGRTPMRCKEKRRLLLRGEGGEVGRGWRCRRKGGGTTGEKGKIRLDWGEGVR